MLVREVFGMAGVIVGAVAGNGFGPFDVEAVLGLTEYGGGSGLVEGSPLSQSAVSSVRGVSAVAGVAAPVHVGPGLDRVGAVADTLSVDERLGVVYRGARAQQEASAVDGAVAAGTVSVDPETGLSTDDVDV